MTIAALVAIAKRMATGPYGYNQADRMSMLSSNGKLGLAGLAATGDADCSSSTRIAYYLASLVGPEILKGDFWTGNAASRLKSTDMFTVTSTAGWSLAKLRKTLRAGDSLVGPGHMVLCVGPNQVLSFESDERGRSAGGKRGDQTGREGRIRSLYSRSRGWAYLIRPISGAALQRQILAAHKAGKSADEALRRYRLRAPWDGPRWTTFMALWEGWEQGMPLAYDPVTLDVPDAGHAFVVLGSALSKSAEVTEKFRRRLALAALALDANPGSVVLISGGAPKATITEAAAGRRWLIDAGIDPARILTEEKSASTIGNARYSVPILRAKGITSYTLVSDASHLRRASTLFAAARLQIETGINRVIGLTPTTPLAFDDYAPSPVKPQGPIDATSRATIADEVQSLLGL